MLTNEIKGRFKDEAMQPNHPHYAAAVGRTQSLYSRKNDIRTPFGRDYTRILHSMAYRRLKHKTQVYFSPANDHVSTRIDHVHYVVSIGRIIADFLGLNGELTEAIAIGHDLGHTPLGHVGESIINDICVRENLMDGADGRYFWHGMNGLHCVDTMELLTGPDGRLRNLDLSYGVRDGIIAHSGNVMDEPLRPRDNEVDLSTFQAPGYYQPYTWEGCIIKLADNISYLGRDIDDARILGLLEDKIYARLTELVCDYARDSGEDATGINNANVIHLLVTDLCQNSTPQTGLQFSPEGYAVMDAVTAINRKYIYSHPRLQAYKDYGHLMIERIYEVLAEWCIDFDNRKALNCRQYPRLAQEFLDFLGKYWDRERDPIYANQVVYHTKDNPKAFNRAIIDYLSGMTDRYIEELYKEQISF